MGLGGCLVRPHRSFKLNSTVKQVVFWLVIVLSGVLLWQVVNGAGNKGVKEHSVSFSQFLAEVQQGKVRDVTITGNEVRGVYRDNTTGFYTTAYPNYPDMIKQLQDKGVAFTVKDVGNEIE